MVIRATDRIADVIARDEGLIDVFARASPAFERLRNPALRRIMARLITVEQAARIAGLDVADLVARLNARAGSPHPGAPVPATPPVPADVHPAPGGPEGSGDGPTLELDVRDELRAGREPFSLIMAAKAKVPEGGTLAIRTIFEPVPLYAVLSKQGFEHRTEKLADDDWIVRFHRTAAPAATPSAADPGDGEPADPGDEAEGVVVLDVRGLEPPEPMVRTLAALETLPADHTLVQINVKEPRFLLPRLAELGFAYEVREQASDLVRVFIRHAEEK
jgi:uncharacterized protein (DUF2249 family)